MTIIDINEQRAAAAARNDEILRQQQAYARELEAQKAAADYARQQLANQGAMDTGKQSGEYGLKNIGLGGQIGSDLSRQNHTQGLQAGVIKGEIMAPQDNTSSSYSSGLWSGGAAPWAKANDGGQNVLLGSSGLLPGGGDNNFMRGYASGDNSISSQLEQGRQARGNGSGLLAGLDPSWAGVMNANQQRAQDQYQRGLANEDWKKKFESDHLGAQYGQGSPAMITAEAHRAMSGQGHETKPEYEKDLEGHVTGAWTAQNGLLKRLPMEGAGASATSTPATTQPAQNGQPDFLKWFGPAGDVIKSIGTSSSAGQSQPSGPTPDQTWSDQAKAHNKNKEEQAGAAAAVDRYYRNKSNPPVAQPPQPPQPPATLPDAYSPLVPPQEINRGDRMPYPNNSLSLWQQGLINPSGVARSAFDQANKPVRSWPPINRPKPQPTHY